jgi:hypothetical protein
MADFSDILQTPEPHGHFVQLYDHDASLLSKNVAHYLSEGLKRDESALVVATREHTDAFVVELQKLGVNTEQAVSESRLLMLDAQRTLGEFMIDGQPDRERFERVIRAAMSKVQVAGPTGLRAYGEMVGILWTAREYTAAIRLEEFWNKLLHGGNFTLFCSYPIDIFAEDFQISGVDALLCDHTHLIPNGTDEVLESAINRAMDERLGSRAHGLRLLIKANYRPSWAVLPKAEAIILWLRNNLPHEAEDILSLARQHYQASEPAAAFSS